MTETTSSIFMIISSAFIILCGEEKHRKRETRIYYQSSDQIKYDIRLCSKESALGAFEFRSAFPAKYNMKSQLKYNKEKCNIRSWKMRENVAGCERKMKTNIRHLGMNYMCIKDPLHTLLLSERDMWVSEVKLQYFGHLMRRVDSLEDSDAGRDWGQEEKGTTEAEMAGWHHGLNGRESE